MTAKNPPNILATDLDGTFIPLAGLPQNQTDLEQIKRGVTDYRINLVFVTGRHLESVLNAIAEFDLPPPDWILCDVGSSIFKRNEEGTFLPETKYLDHLQQRLGDRTLDEVRDRLPEIEGLRLQEPEKQGRFKLSYYTDADQLNDLHHQIAEHLDKMNVNSQIIASVDPFNNDGLIDVLPPGVSKAFALDWWVQFCGASRDDIVFAGDSGNDLAALTAGFQTIVVGNAHDELRQAVKKIHQEKQWIDRLCLPSSHATSAVLEGCHWFGMFDGRST